MTETNKDTLPYTTGELAFIQKTEQIPVQDFHEPKNTHKPMRSVGVKVYDARPLRSELDLEKQGFILLDHKTKVGHLRDPNAMRDIYQDEIRKMVTDLAGDADMILPCNFLLRVSKNAPPTEHVTERNFSVAPSRDVHIDFTARSISKNVDWAHDNAGVERVDYRKYSRIIAYQTWRVLSEPPHDYPMALADRRSVPPSHYLEMDNILGPRDNPKNVIESGMGLEGNHDWYYFGGLNKDELVVFSGYDSAYGHDMNVFHASIDDRARHPDASPRVSIESRFVAVWH